MANLTHSSKLASNWTRADLDLYNITLLHQNAATFFETHHLPQSQLSQVNPEILNIQDALDMTIGNNQELINLLDLAMIPISPEEPPESAVCDFTFRLFQMLHYAWDHHLVCTRRNIQLLVCGKLKHAKVDVSLFDCYKGNFMLLVQENKHFGDSKMARGDANAQLIAGAVAAFSYNNHRRWETRQPLVESQVCASYF